MSYVLTRNELYHHGIAGQKWGVRNGPPYPLSEDKHSKAEKDAAKKFHLTDEQKKYLKIGVAVAATGIAVYGVYKLSQSGILDKYADSGKDQLRKMYGYNIDSPEVTEYMNVEQMKAAWDTKCAKADFKSLDEIERFDPSALLNENGKLRAKVLAYDNNPDWPDTPGAQNNCSMAVANMVMRMKGYNTASANCDSLDEGWPFVIFTHWFSNSETGAFTDNTRDGIIKQLSSQGNGAYGALDTLLNEANGGQEHGFFYYIEDGTAKFIDSQINEPVAADTLFDKIVIDKCAFCQLDQSEPTEKVLGAIRRS